MTWRGGGDRAAGIWPGGEPGDTFEPDPEHAKDTMPALDPPRSGSARTAPVRAARALAALALAACGGDGGPLAFGPLQPWAEPIADAIAAGEEAFPDGFRRNITTLRAHGGRLWMGYGDGTANLGSVTPVEFRWFAAADDSRVRAAVVLGEGQGAPQRTPTDTGEEQIDPFRICLGALCMAGSDSVNDDEAWTQARDPRRLIEGNVFRLEERDGEPVWRKFRSVPGGEHVHDLAEIDGVIYAVGSGADDRAEWESGRIFRYLWKSEDGGATFTTVARFLRPHPDRGDTRFRRLLAAGGTLYVFGYVDPSEREVPREGRHLVLRDGDLTDLGGDLGPLYVERTYETSPATGLAVARGESGGTRAFALDAEGYRELSGWSARRAVDVAPLPREGRFLLLSGDGAAPERFAVHAFDAADPDALVPVADLDVEAPTALAYFDGALFVGTNDGRVLRAMGVR